MSCSMKAQDHDLQMVPSLESSQLPIIDFSLLHQNSQSSAKHIIIIQQLHQACREMGFFHLINHGISESVIQEALDVNLKFFELPTLIKEELASDDVYKPVRFVTVRGGGIGGSSCQFSRDFLKLYANPFLDFVDFWPLNPSDYREKMGMYTKEVRKLAIEIFGAIMESLDLGATYLEENFEQGMHIIGANSYPTPTSQESNIQMGNPPHSDHSIFTILLQSDPGLHVMDHATGAWKSMPELKGSLQVLVGDHLEVLSNGSYKSLVHRAVPSSGNSRMSIVSLHSLGMDEIVEPALKLVDEKHPKGYKGSSLKDFLKHHSSKEKKPFIETLKI